MIPNLWQYISAALGVALFSLGIYTFALNAEINSLTKDVADQKVLITKWESKSEKQKTAIALQKTSEKTNSETIKTLIKEIEKLISLDESKNSLHAAEIQKYKKLIEALESKVVITGELEIEECKIKIMEVDYENDYIGNTFSNIGS